MICEPRNVETSETKKAATKTRRATGRGHRRTRPRRPRRRQQPDAPRTLSTPDRRHAGARRPRRRAKAKHPHRPELPLLRGRRDELYGEVEAVAARHLFPSRHARPCARHPRLYAEEEVDVDVGDESGHGDLERAFS
jgi:hypothetical protein